MCWGARNFGPVAASCVLTPPPASPPGVGGDQLDDVQVAGAAHRHTVGMLMPVNGSTVPDDCESLRPMAAGMANTCQQFIASANSSKFPAMRSKWPASGVASTTRPCPYSNGRDT